MKKFAPWFMLLGLCSLTAFAQDRDALPSNFLRGTHVKHANKVAGGIKKRGNIPTPHGFPSDVDTLTNFTGHYEAQGIFWNGSAHNVWEYSMVGNSPDHGGTTKFNAPVVPVSLDLRNADGSIRYVKQLSDGSVQDCGGPGNGCVRLYYDATQFVTPFMNGPVFGEAHYSSSPTDTQVTDAIQRAEFGNQARADWHTLLSPALQTPEVMTLNKGTYYFALNGDGSCCLFVLVDYGTFGNAMFPTTTPDTTTIVGDAEVTGAIHTKDISTFMFPNTYLYFNGDPNQCCVLGYHTFDYEAGDSSNGNRLRFYVLNYSSWITPGLFGPDFQDITAHSHEIAETFNDPFIGFDGIHNITPFWLNPAGQCQDVMEVGDVIEDLPNPTYPVTMNGYTYHPQTEALLPWFEFQKNSMAINNAYSYPNESVLTSLSAPQPLNCNGQ